MSRATLIFEEIVGDLKPLRTVLLSLRKMYLKKVYHYLIVKIRVVD